MMRIRTYFSAKSSARFISFLLLTLLGANLVTADESRVLQSTVYEADYEGLHVKMTRELVSLGEGRYRLEAHAKNFFGSIRENEEFLWDKENGIRSLAYEYQQKVFGVKRERKIEFDWKKNIAYSNDKGKKRDIPIEPGVLGPMTYQLQLRMDLTKNLKLAEDATSSQRALPQNYFTYRFIKRRKIKEYQFKAITYENISSDDYQVENALKVTRTNEGDDRQTNIWLDPSQNHTIISIEQEEDGDSKSLFILSNKFYPPLDGSPLKSSSES